MSKAQAAEKVLLRALDPHHSGIIDIEEFVISKQKSLVQRVPGHLQAVVSSILKSYVYAQHSFVMPVPVFLQEFKAAASRSQGPVARVSVNLDASKFKPPSNAGHDNARPRHRHSLSIDSYALRHWRLSAAPACLSPVRAGRVVDSVVQVRQRHLEFTKRFAAN